MKLQRHSAATKPESLSLPPRVAQGAEKLFPVLHFHKRVTKHEGLQVVAPPAQRLGQAVFFPAPLPPPPPAAFWPGFRAPPPPPPPPGGPPPNRGGEKPPAAGGGGGGGAGATRQ